MIADGPAPGLHQLRSVIDAAPAAFVAVDGHGLVTLWNPAAEQLLGWPASEVLGRPDPTVPLRERDPDQPAHGDRQRVLRRRRDGSCLELTAVRSALDDVSGPACGGTLTVYADRVDPGRLAQRLAVRARQQAGVVALGEVALSAASMAQVAAEAVAVVARTLDLPAVVLLRHDGTGSGPDHPPALVTTAVHASGRPTAGPWAGGVPGPVPGPVLGPAVRAAARRTAVVGDVADLPPDEAGLLAAEGIGAVAAVLVGKATDPWGVLLATAREAGSFGQDDVWFLQSVAAVVAAADARRLAEAEVRHRATHDALTGLPNRDLLVDRLRDELSQARGRRLASALLLLDLDGFKDVNDSHGHQAGDHVLVQVADRLRIAIGARGTVARLGGDEFAVVLGGLASALDARAAAEDLVAALDTPFRVPGGPVRIGGSIGVALAPGQGDDPTTLLMHADLAMYRAKRERAGYALFDPRRDHDAGDRLALVTELHDAIADGGLRVEYQPFVALRSHRVWGAEALLRWTSPRLGPQSPAEFVALAEQSGLIEEITALVLRSAAAQAARWRDAGHRLAVSVNVSPVALAGADFGPLVTACMTAHELDADLLRLEVTESSLANDAAVAALDKLAADGLKIALDDFGTGYSSLARLKRLPVCQLKIDRSFVQGLADDPLDQAILRSVMTLARDLGLAVAAEGIETPRTARTATRLGVHLAQGLLYAPAMPADALDAWAARWSSGAWTCCTPDAGPPPSEAADPELSPALVSHARRG